MGEKINVEMLKKIKEMLVELQAYPDHLRMIYFGGIDSKKVRAVDKAAECGCTGCILGWSWTCIEPLLSDETAIGYFDRTCVTISANAREKHAIFGWLFDSFWGDVAPTPQDAIKRIDWLLANDVETLVRRMRSISYAQDFTTLWEEIKNDTSIQ